MISGKGCLSLLSFGTGIILIWLTFRYFKWKLERRTELWVNSRVLDTNRGSLEIAMMGQGPPVLILHGTPGGYDQGLALANLISLPEFEFLCVSRPGYLKTPLSTGKIPAQQADALAALLDEIDADPVAVMGVSDGGPIALEFALRYPDRCWGIIMVAGVTQKAFDDKQPMRMRMMSQIVQWELLTNLAAILSQVWPKIIVQFAISNVEQRSMVVEDSEKLFHLTALMQTNSMFSLRRDGRRNDLAQVRRLIEYKLANLKILMNVFHGSDDFNVPVSHAELIA